MTQRGAELAHQLGLVHAQIDRACADADRDPAGVTLIAVSKGWPVADISILRELGVVDFGENRAEELAAKAEQWRGDVRWHFMGQIQSRKAAAIARVADVVHSVDRDKVIRTLGSQGRDLEVFIQVSLDDHSVPADPGRGGAPPGDVERLAARVEAEPALRLRGVMTLPPRDAERVQVFGRLAQISAELRREHPSATAISAGMSGDFAAAIAAGATHVRIGSALFGPRNAVR